MPPNWIDKTHLNFYLSIALAAISLGAVPAYARTCGLVSAFQQPNRNVKTLITSVRSTQTGDALVFRTPLNVNTDGTKRSYSVSDFWGSATALNNLCNAMTDKCEMLDTDEKKRQRRIATQTARQNGWPKDQLDATKISPSIIEFDITGKPCEDSDGFLISATALFDSSKPKRCDKARYIDSLLVPAIVVPRNPKGGESEFSKKGVRIGDLAAIWHPKSGRVVFAVVGDTGPLGSLGEASLAANGALLGREQPPDNYKQVRGKPPYVGQQWTVADTVTVIFPKTARTPDYLTKEDIDKAAKPVFESFGGVQRLSRCLTE